jgi:hypothetical protein
MRRQDGLGALPCAIGKERRFVAADLQHRRAEGMEEAVGVARAKSGARAARDDNERLMPALPACLAQSAGLCAIRWNLGKPDRCVAVEASEHSGDARRARECAVEERQPLDRAAVDRKGRTDRIDPAQRKFLKRRFEADLAHRVGEPVSGYAIGVCSGAMKALGFVRTDHRADALRHTALQFADRHV